MKKIKLFSLVILITILVSSCGNYYTVEQEIRESKYTLKTEFATYVWCNNEIIKVWYDPIDSVNSTLVKIRQAQADSLIAALKKSRY